MTSLTEYVSWRQRTDMYAEHHVLRTVTIRAESGRGRTLRCDEDIGGNVASRSKALYTAPAA